MLINCPRCDAATFDDVHDNMCAQTCSCGLTRTIYYVEVDAQFPDGKIVRWSLSEIGEVGEVIFDPRHDEMGIVIANPGTLNVEVKIYPLDWKISTDRIGKIILLC